MKKIVFVLSVLLLGNSVNAWAPKEQEKATSGFGLCTFEKTEKDTDGLFVFLNCGKKTGTEKCYVQKDRQSYKKLESGEIWNKLDKTKLIVTRDEQSGRRTITKVDKKGKFEGYFTGDCITFYTQEMAYDLIKDKYMEAKHDAIELPFVDHPEVLGKWIFVDYVTEIDEFDPASKKWKNGNHGIKEVVFLNNGKTKKPYMTWTKEVLIHKGDVTASKYVIKKFGEKDYLFVEHKNGDYIYRHQTPKYVVFEKVTRRK